MKKAFALAIAACLLPALGYSLSVVSAAPPSTVPVRVDFHDLGNRITSDARWPGGGTAYVNGDRGVEADINPNTGDLRLNLNMTKRPRRRMLCDLLGEVNMDGTQCGVDPVRNAAVPDDTEAAFLNVGIGPGDLLNMPENVPTKMHAFFSTDVGALRLQKDRDLNLGSYGNCSGEVLVTRTSPQTWTISTTDIAVLVQSSGNTSVPAGYYVASFSITVTKL